MSKLQERVDQFLAQERIAVVGIRTTMEDAANGIYRKLKDTGYQVFAVNPKTTEFEGDPCYPSVNQIPGGVQAAVMVVRPELSEEIMEDCVEAGVGHVWIHRSIGPAVSEKAVAYGKEHGINVIGGACPMMYVKPVDFGHVCLKFVGRFAGWLPSD